MTEQDVLKDPTGLGNQITTREFIKSEIDDLVSAIEMIERKSGKALIGDRVCLDRPYEDCKNMTNLQVNVIKLRQNKNSSKPEMVRVNFFCHY